MTTHTQRAFAAVIAGSAMLFTAACGSSGAHTPSSPSRAAHAPAAVVTTGPNASVIAAMHRWVAAATPAQACAAVSTGFAMFLGNGTASGCPSHIRSVLGELQHGTADITAVTFQRGEAVVTAAIPPLISHYNSYYFVSEGGQWKLNSIGTRREPLPPASSAAPSAP